MVLFASLPVLLIFQFQNFCITPWECLQKKQNKNWNIDNAIKMVKCAKHVLHVSKNFHEDGGQQKLHECAIWCFSYFHFPKLWEVGHYVYVYVNKVVQNHCKGQCYWIGIIGIGLFWQPLQKVMIVMTNGMLMVDDVIEMVECAKNVLHVSNNVDENWNRNSINVLIDAFYTLNFQNYEKAYHYINVNKTK